MVWHKNPNENRKVLKSLRFEKEEGWQDVKIRGRKVGAGVSKITWICHLCALPKVCFSKACGFHTWVKGPNHCPTFVSILDLVFSFSFFLASVPFPFSSHVIPTPFALVTFLSFFNSFPPPLPLSSFSF